MATERPPTSAYYGIAEYDRADYGVALDERFVRPPGVVAARTMRQPGVRGRLTLAPPVLGHRIRRASGIDAVRVRRDLRGET